MERSQELFDRAQKVLPGGVNSPVRAFRAVELCPRFIERADGAYIYDADGKHYIDYVCSWGPMLLGHNHPAVREAVERAVKDGLSFGAPTQREVEMAELMVEMVPNIEMGPHGELRYGGCDVCASLSTGGYRPGQTHQI